MIRALVFPGQGSQFIGMGKELCNDFLVAKQVFDEIDETLGYKLSSIIFEGPAEQLTLTENTQPALLAASMAVFKVLKQEAGFTNLKDFAGFVAGHSLGEYSALAASETFSINDAAKLVHIRGKAMQSAVPAGIGGMAALLGVNFEEAQEIANSASSAQERCQIANDNSEGQIVLSGSAKAIDRAIEIAASLKKKAIKLAVSAPFHSELMFPVKEIMLNALNQTKMNDSLIPVIPNVSVIPTSDCNAIKDLLVEQVTGMVRWRQTILKFKELGVTEIIEIGAGKVLTNLTKRIDPEMKSINLQTIEDIRLYLK